MLAASFLGVEHHLGQGFFLMSVQFLERSAQYALVMPDHAENQALDQNFSVRAEYEVQPCSGFDPRALVLQPQARVADVPNPDVFLQFLDAADQARVVNPEALASFGTASGAGSRAVQVEHIFRCWSAFGSAFFGGTRRAL